MGVDKSGVMCLNSTPLVCKTCRLRTCEDMPSEWRTWSPKVILRGDSTEPDASGNIFLTNIHQLYESREQDWVAANPIDAMLGRLPSKDLSSYQRSMLERVKALKDLVVINDE